MRVLEFMHAERIRCASKTNGAHTDSAVYEERAPPDQGWREQRRPEKARNFPARFYVS